MKMSYAITFMSNPWARLATLLPICPNPMIPKTTPDLKVAKDGVVIVDNETMKTSKKGVFAGGDVATGGATVILAMGQGKKAAKAIDEYLRTGNW